MSRQITQKSRLSAKAWAASSKLGGCGASTTRLVARRKGRAKKHQRFDRKRSQRTQPIVEDLINEVLTKLPGGCIKQMLLIYYLITDWRLATLGIVMGALLS